MLAKPLNWVCKGPSESFGNRARSSDYRVLAVKTSHSPSTRDLLSNPQNGLAETFESICTNSRPCCYPRISKSHVFVSGFNVVASENSLNYRRKCVRTCIGLGSDSLNGFSWSASEIAKAVNGKIVKWAPPGTICTDTRNLNPGQWFFALVGENFDGHDFVSSALYDKGCVGVIGNRICENWERGFIDVEGHTTMALVKLANYARNRFENHVVGVTGSVGKTTTRTMIALALESVGQVYQTYMNQNSKIGVALTLIGMPMSANVSVLELGMSGKGEILELARMCRPTVRVILNVGHCHMENFGSLEELARAKGEILMEAKEGDVCVLNAEDPLVMSSSVPNGVKKVLFGRRMGCDVRLVFAETINGGAAVRVILEHRTREYNKTILVSEDTAPDMVEFKISCPGLHLAMNACAAAAVAVSLGVPLSEVGKSLSRFTPVKMRSELEIAENGITIINDVYNANPTSTRAAINVLQAMDCRGKRVPILGDMLELGAAEQESHEAVLNLCCHAGFDLVALAGKRFHSAVKSLNLLEKVNIICAFDSESLALKIVEKLTTDDVVLVKGSRAMQMEKVVDAIKAMNS